MDMSAVLEFLPCRTPEAWIACAADDIELLLLDHASLELKAAQQAQKLMWSYGVPASAADAGLDDALRLRLLNTMSRLAREELRHFEQVIALLARRGVPYRAISASRYAARLHEHVRRNEPGRLVDALIVGAIIEARSCERFYSLMPTLLVQDAELANFYCSLLRSEARHFENYLDLAGRVSGSVPVERVSEIMEVEAALVQSDDDVMRFHSGIPV